MKRKHFIDSHKALTGPFVLLLIALYGQWHNATAWAYLALHGTYGLLWVLKSRIFPDRQWEQPAGWRFGLIAWGGLTVYWVAPWLLTSRSVQAPAWYMGLCIALYAVGVFMHFASDMQKSMWLKLRPGELLREGLWVHLRNPNYFGELLIYLGFGLLAMHWLPVLLLALFVAVYWLPNMRRKDRALALLPGFDTYRATSKLFIPFIF